MLPHLPSALEEELKEHFAADLIPLMAGGLAVIAVPCYLNVVLGVWVSGVTNSYDLSVAGGVGKEAYLGEGFHCALCLT